jgi:hypothetical protein
MASYVWRIREGILSARFGNLLELRRSGVGAVERSEAAIFSQAIESRAKDQDQDQEQDQKIAAFGSSYGLSTGL